MNHHVLICGALRRIDGCSRLSIAYVASQPNGLLKVAASGAWLGWCQHVNERLDALSFVH